MSRNEIPRDKNGKPLRSGQWVKVKSPPEFLSGRIMYVGKERSFVMPFEKKGEDIDNAKIEVKID